MAVKEKDNTPRYLRAINTLEKKVIKSGLLAAAGTENIKKGIDNEFGVPQRNVPERSFIRSTFDEEKNNVTKRFKQVYKSINEGDYRVVEKLKRIGIEHEGKVKKKITDLRTPPNAPSTIALKGFDNPLIHTGEMRQKVSSEVIDG